ncbi:MAG: helix-turn-helix domain-containing protein [Atopobiaceae bacterium]|nr:helix-turn-helix domain-containing protein [Atopobiaceae bacterium]
MPRPRFSEMLVTRRRQLGLSISQASQVLRLKEQVLIAFEEGDFDHIPKSGYAQGMLSSYARYLGLNPRQVVNQFSADLSDYVKSGAPRNVDDDSSGYGSSPYVASRGLLPTSGGPAGDLGAFATTSQPHSRQQSAPLVNQRRYVGSLHDETERVYGYDVEDEYYSGVEQRPYTTRQPYSTQRTRAASARARARRSSDRSSYARSGSYVRDEVTTRRVAPSQYTDDLRYDDETSSYEAASTGSGRQKSRNIASTRRPNVKRRASDTNRGRGRDVPHRRGGVVGAVIDFFSDGTHALVALIGLLAIALTFVIIFSVRSCVNNNSTEADRGTVPVTQSEQSSETEKKEDALDKAVDAANDALKEEKEGEGGSTSDTTSTTKKTETPKETKVVVSVESGMVSWVEILCDGESKIATTVTGPWSETYDVHESITIEVGDTTAVTVTENGAQRQFDSKTSGIGTITIQGTPEAKTTNTDANQQGSGEQNADQGDNASGDSNESSQNNEGNNNNSSQHDTGEDEYLYNYNGYDIYYSADEDLYYFIDESGQRINAQDGTPA